MQSPMLLWVFSSSCVPLAFSLRLPFTLLRTALSKSPTSASGANSPTGRELVRIRSYSSLLVGARKGRRSCIRCSSAAWCPSQ